MRYNIYYISVAIATLVVATAMLVYRNIKYGKEMFESEDAKPYITFVIPSIGRPTIDMTLRSLIGLRDPNWRAIVVYDGVSASPTVVDPRIDVVHNEKLGSAGATRNSTIDRIQTDWVGFVDDDDALSPDYINNLRTVVSGSSDADIVVFRMRYNDGRILPEKNNGSILRFGGVGISFAIRTPVFREIPFKPIHAEDFNLLKDAKQAGKNIILAEHISYAIRPSISDAENPKYWKDPYESVIFTRETISDVEQ